MKRRILLTGILSVAMAAVFFYFFQQQSNTPDRPKLLPGEWMGQQRMFPYNEIKAEAYHAAVKSARIMQQNSLSRNFEWEFVGPTNIGGRITDLEMPANQSDIMYVGAATGGVLKTEDAGQTWHQLFHDVPTISVGDMAINPQNPNEIYVGTGEANSSSFSFLGSGVYKSQDAGQTWNFVGLENSAYIGRMIVDHQNPNRVYAAACGLLFTPNTDRGIYRSSDAGQSWEQVLFVSDTTSAIDLVQHPVHADTLYAAFWERARGLTTRRSFGKTSGIYRTHDGGDSWQQLTSGLPNALLEKGRIGLTISQSNPNVLYAMYDMPDEAVLVYKTTDGGDSWIQIDNGYLNSSGSNFGWYFGQIRVHPEDENTVFTLGQYLWRTSNSGSSWTKVNGSDLHVDHHAMCFDAATGKTWLGNDGGLYYSTNLGNSWIKVNNLPITQFYAYDVSETNQDFQVGGTQDNNSIRTIGGNTEMWESVLGGDGMYNRINQQNNDIAWAEYQYGALHVSFNAQDSYPTYDYVSYDMQGDRINWSAPLELTPGQNQVAYFGTHRVWKTTNNGNSWTAVSGDLTQGGTNYFHSLSCLAVSAVNTGYVLAGSADGRVNLSTNSGMSWEDISAGLPTRWITDVEFDPQLENTIYATISGFRWDEALPHVFKSDDLGQNWVGISGNLPELPVNALVIDPDDSNEIVVGTDAGLYMTTDGGQTWESISANLPMVPVVALKLIPQTKDLYAATYGLSTWKINLTDVNVGIKNPATAETDFEIQWQKGAGDMLVLHNSKAQKFQLRIYNLAGQMVLEQSQYYEAGEQRISLSKMTTANGGFVVEVIGERGRKILKVVL